MRSLAAMFVFSHVSVLIQNATSAASTVSPPGHFQSFVVIVTALPPSLHAGALAGDAV
jgi:hypothetical protein